MISCWLVFLWVLCNSIAITCFILPCYLISLWTCTSTSRALSMNIFSLMQSQLINLMLNSYFLCLRCMWICQQFMIYRLWLRHLIIWFIKRCYNEVLDISIRRFARCSLRLSLFHQFFKVFYFLVGVMKRKHLRSLITIFLSDILLRGLFIMKIKTISIVWSSWWVWIFHYIVLGSCNRWYQIVLPDIFLNHFLMLLLRNYLVFILWRWM